MIFTTEQQRIALAVSITCLLAWLGAYLAIIVYRDYVFGLFVWLPTVMGITSTVVLGYKNPVSFDKLRKTTFISLLIFCVGLLLFAFEGIICVVMAAPIAFLFNWIGYRLGKIILTKGIFGSPPLMNLLFIASVPLMMAFENTFAADTVQRNVVTTVDIAASPEVVWQNVVAFPQLDDPNEFIFKFGIAYPINATIRGEGVGAIRHCNFSTGSFVEPITHWEKPNLLAFDVVDQPEPMKELSFYDLHPNHLHGYWVSQKGQFKLTQLENGHTRLEGTTWYVNRIKPDMYWTLWSDFIVHKIHERVLNHIKKVSEKG